MGRQESTCLCDKKREAESSCPNAGVQVLKKKKRQREKKYISYFFQISDLFIGALVKFKLLTEFTVKSAECVQISLKRRPEFLTSC